MNKINETKVKIATKVLQALIKRNGEGNDETKEQQCEVAIEYANRLVSRMLQECWLH